MYVQYLNKILGQNKNYDNFMKHSKKFSKEASGYVDII